MRSLRLLLAVLAAAVLTWSFWRSAGWLQLCAGLAMFLFGMQCLEEGLRKLAGGRLEQWLARSTGTPARGLLFGIGGTMLLQSSTLVSLLTIAFISSGLIQLAGGIAIVFGANLGATSGIWLLALAGQNFSLSPLALPLLVFGVLVGFSSAPRNQAAGRIVLGVAFILLGIDQIKEGFAEFGGGMDMASGVPVSGIAGTLLFAGVGMVATVILQSSHATLMLTLAALAAGQLEAGQSLAVAIGANVGSSVSTAFVGSLGGNRSGQRLALAHVLFNAVTAGLALLALPLLAWLVRLLSAALGFADNALLQLALFHTIFNSAGVALFWPWQAGLARLLERWLPDRGDIPMPAGATAAPPKKESETVRARHLSDQALESVDAASAAVALELRHLGHLGLEVVGHALYLTPDQLAQEETPEEAWPAIGPGGPEADVDALYRRRIKGVYGDLLSFMGRLELPMDEAHQRFWAASQVAALQLVDAVKDARHLQKNLGRCLSASEASAQRDAYVSLRRHLVALLRGLLALDKLPQEDRQAALEALDARAVAFETAFRQQLFSMVRRHELDSLTIGSLMNDLGHAMRIFQGLRGVMAFDEDEPPSLRHLRELMNR